MKNLYKLKRLCHVFINNIFYFIVFLIGFFIGFLGKEFFKLENVFADELPVSILPSSNYEFLPSWYSEYQVLDRLQAIVDYFHENYSDEYGITIALVPNYTNDNYNKVYDGGYGTSSYLSELAIYYYRKDEFSDYIRLTNTWSYNYYEPIYSTTISKKRSFAQTIEFKNSGLFLNTPLTEFENWIENNFNFNSLYKEPSELIGTGYNSTSVYQDKKADFLLYHSDVDIIYRNSSMNYSLNNEVVKNGDVFTPYTKWKSEQKESVLDNMTYVCTSKPFVLSEKNGSDSDYQKTDIYNSYIYFDYDIPSDLYSYLFDFWKYSVSNGWKIRQKGYIRWRENGILSGVQNILGNLDKLSSDDLLYTVPVTLDTTSSVGQVFYGYATFWDLPLPEDTTQKHNWYALKNLNNYTIDFKSKYFYDFLVYKGFIDMPYLSYKETYSKEGVNKLVFSTYGNIDNLPIKGDYIHYLLTVRIDKGFPSDMCFYYDSNNLFLSYANKDENGNLNTWGYVHGELTDFNLNGNDYYCENEGEFILDSNLKSPLNYLSKMVDIMWNKLPSGIKIVFLSVFTLTLIFMFLKMVGYYG